MKPLLIRFVLLITFPTTKSFRLQPRVNDGWIASVLTALGKRISFSFIDEYYPNCRRRCPFLFISKAINEKIKQRLMWLYVRHLPTYVFMRITAKSLPYRSIAILIVSSSPIQVRCWSLSVNTMQGERACVAIKVFNKCLCWSVLQKRQEVVQTKSWGVGKVSVGKCPFPTKNFAQTRSN